MPLRSSSFLSLSLACGAAGQKHRKEGRRRKNQAGHRGPSPLVPFIHGQSCAIPSHACSKPRTNEGEKRPGLCVARSLHRRGGRHALAQRGFFHLFQRALAACTHGAQFVESWPARARCLSHYHSLMPIDFPNLYGSPNLAYTIGAHHK